jgi:hypothetical protein
VLMPAAGSGSVEAIAASRMAVRLEEASTEEVVWKRRSSRGEMGAIPTELSIIVRTIRGLVTPVRRCNSRMPRIALLWWGRAGAAALAMVA